MTEYGKPQKVHHLNFFYDKFPDYDFAEEEELFLDAYQMQTLQQIQVTKVILESYSKLILNIPIPDKKQKFTRIFTFTLPCDTSKGFSDGLNGYLRTFLRTPYDYSCAD